MDHSEQGPNKMSLNQIVDDIVAGTDALHSWDDEASTDEVASSDGEVVTEHLHHLTALHTRIVNKSKALRQ